MDCTIIECIFMKSNEMFLKHKYLKFQLNIMLQILFIKLLILFKINIYRKYENSSKCYIFLN